MENRENALKAFAQAINNIDKELKNQLLLLPKEDQIEITELRLYLGQPMALLKNRKVFFLTSSGKLSPQAENCPKLSRKNIEESFRALCGYSVHTHQLELSQGFLSLPGGHRAGICGTAVYLDERFVSLREITSIDLRIAKRISGCSNELYEKVFKGKRPTSLLLVGAPATGKTTILRDLAKNLAGPVGGYFPTVIIDERGELSGVEESFGITTHILCGIPKATGILQAVRTLAPQYILCDELGTVEEAKAILSSLNAGVKMITTVHAGSKEELLRRKQVRILLASHGFETVVFLEDNGQPGRIKEIWKVKQYAENYRKPVRYSFGGHMGHIQSSSTEKECI